MFTTAGEIVTVYYLAGPMAGYPHWNHPAFHAAAAQLRSLDHTVINPAEYGNLVTGWMECMKRDVHALLWCDAVIVLPGWEKSRGATLETNLADDLCMPVFDLHIMLNGILGKFSISSETIRAAYNAMHPRPTIRVKEPSAYIVTEPTP
jgi:hypothetical protein